MSIILLIIIMRFSLHFHEFLTILSLPIFFSRISADISDISVKSKYRYIRDYRYFHHWLGFNNIILKPKINHPKLIICVIKGLI